MATKAKTTKLAEHVPPSAITDNTKARRAWLADKATEVAETTNLPGVFTKVLGTGSYQTLGVYQTVQVEGRVQLRGTCQRCAREQAVTSGRIAYHGYERPGYGYTTGGCQGTNLAPAEVSIACATVYHATAKEDAMRFHAVADKYAALSATLPHLTYAEKTALDASIPRIEVPDTSWRKGMTKVAGWTDLCSGWQRQSEHVRGLAKSAAHYAEALEEHVFPKLGQPLVEVVLV